MYFDEKRVYPGCGTDAGFGAWGFSHLGNSSGGLSGLPMRNIN